MALLSLFFGGYTVEFYEEFDLAIKECGWTNIEVADKIGASPSAVGNWRKGRHLPKSKYWEVIEKLFKINVSEYYLQNPFNIAALINLEAEVVRRGGKLVKSTYTNNNSKAMFICSEGHKFWSTSNRVSRRAGWCPKCAGLCPEQAKQNLHDIVKTRGGVILGGYKNNHTKVLIDCGKGHKFNIVPNAVTSQNQWCSKCSGHCPELAEQKFRDKVEVQGGIVLSKYINSNTKILLDCGKGHQFSITPHDLISHWCPKCAGLCPTQAKHLFIEKIELRGGVVIGEHINTRTKVLINCGKGHKFSIRPNDVMSNYWCPWCDDLSRSSTRLLGVAKHSSKWRAKINSEVFSVHFTPEKAARARDAEVIKRGLHLEPHYYPLNYPV